MDDNNPGAARRAWNELLAVLADADRSFLSAERGTFDDSEVAYGYRNLVHVLGFATGMYLNADPDRPTFAPSLKDPPFEKTLGECPDVHYRWAPVRGGSRYRITGRRGDEAYLSFTLHRGVRGSGRELYFDSHVNHHDLRTDADGNFEIIVSPERQGENWMRCSPDATEIYARAYMLDRLRGRPATYSIEALDPPPPERLTTDEVAARFAQMTRLVTEMCGAFPQPLSNPNTLGEEPWTVSVLEVDGNARMWTALDNYYKRGVFSLGSDEAFVIEGVVGTCDYWGVQLWGPFLGSGNHRDHPVSINAREAHLGPNGEFRVAIAHEDPRVPGLDWVSTAGEHQGTVIVRWLCPDVPPPSPTSSLVTLDELRATARVRRR